MRIHGKKKQRVALIDETGEGSVYEVDEELYNAILEERAGYSDVAEKGKLVTDFEFALNTLT